MRGCLKSQGSLFNIALLDNKVGLIGLSRFLQLRSVFYPRTLSVWSCSFRKPHSHHHEIFYRQEQSSLPLRCPKKTPLTAKNAPALRSVAWLRGQNYRKQQEITRVKIHLLLTSGFMRCRHYLRRIILLLFLYKS